MNEFQALLNSLLDHCVTYIQQDADLHAVAVQGDSLTRSATIEIVLEADSWEQELRVIDRMVEIREMFIEDVAISYSFVNIDDWAREETDADLGQYVYATN